MSTFDYIGDARAIRDALDKIEWRQRIDQAIAAGSTGTEIVLAVRWNLAELLKAEPTLNVELVSRIKDYIMEANKILN